jgi:hypothetical protein
MRRTAVLSSLLLVLFLVSGCEAPVVPTATPIPTVAPTELPPPTDTPVPSVKIQDLVGWWNLNGTQFFLRFDPDSRMAAVMSSGDYRLNGISNWDGPLALKDGVVEIRARYLEAACASDLLGRYRVEVATPDKLEWSMIEDPCVDRRVFFENVEYTRARPLEMLTGVWKAGSKDGATLTFRDNLLYQVSQSDGGEVAPLVWGAYNWDAQASQVMFYDDPVGPCGLSLGGAYQMTLDADRRLKLTPVMDPCEKRRSTLSEWGPYTRVEAPAWAGRYVAQSAERYMLDLSATGVYVLRDRDAATASPLREGIFDVEGQQMRLQELMGTVHCSRSPVEYKFQLAGDTLSLAATDDACGERQSFFASHPTWVRIKE